MTKKAKKVVSDMSAFCRHGGYEGAHRNCKETWETPSVIVVCPCQCHVVAAAEAAERAKRRVKHTLKVQPPRRVKRTLKRKK